MWKKLRNLVKSLFQTKNLKNKSKKFYVDSKFLTNRINYTDLEVAQENNYLTQLTNNNIKLIMKQYSDEITQRKGQIPTQFINWDFFVMGSKLPYYDRQFTYTHFGNEFDRFLFCECCEMRYPRILLDWMNNIVCYNPSCQLSNVIEMSANNFLRLFDITSTVTNLEYIREFKVDMDDNYIGG